MRVRFSFCLLFCLALFGVSLAVPAQAMTVFSPVVELRVAPGEEQRGLLKLYNETDTPQALTAKIERFTAADQSGTPAFVSGDAASQDQFLNWFAVDTPTIQVAPEQVGLIPFTVRVPASATPGGYYAAIFWEPVVAETVGNLRVTSRVGTLVLVTVTGDLRETAELQSFTRVPDRNVVTGLPLTFTATLANTGNVHIQPTGALTIRSWFGRTTTIPLNSNQRSILPETSRTFTLDWGSSSDESVWQQFWNQAGQEFSQLAIGKYTAQISVLVTASSSPVTATQTFWVVPTHALSVIGLVTLALIIFFMINRAMRRLRARHFPHAS
jgi:hypothetical protein